MKKEKKLHTMVYLIAFFLVLLAIMLYALIASGEFANLM